VLASERCWRLPNRWQAEPVDISDVIRNVIGGMTTANHGTNAVAHFDIAGPDVHALGDFNREHARLGAIAAGTPTSGGLTTASADLPGEVQLAFSPTPLTCGTAAGAVGCTDWSQWPLPHVEIYTGEGPYWAHEYLMHELGHVFDATEMEDQFRAAFMAIWRLPGGASAWWTLFGSGDGSPGEWFAESYRLCALYRPQMPYQPWKVDSPAYGFPATATRPSRTPHAGLSSKSAPCRACRLRPAQPHTRRAYSCKRTARSRNATATTFCCSAIRCCARRRAAALQRDHGSSSSTPGAWARPSSVAPA
jgi:hypothetical protein